MIERGIKQALDANDLRKARRIINGGFNGLENVNRKNQLYLEAVKTTNSTAETLQIPGVQNPAWLKVHVPAILKAMREKQITDPVFQAYILAIADHESSEGRFMEEIPN
jgi:predicted chitinase